MPEHPSPKLRPHPNKSPDNVAAARPRRRSHGYAELCVTSNFTFLTGASHPEEFVEQAAALGHRAAAVTDVNTVAGIVRGHVAAKRIGMPFIVGCRARFHVDDDRMLRVLLYPTDRAAYGNMCRLLTTGKRRAPKGECHLTLHDLIEHQAGLLATLVPPDLPDLPDDLFLQAARGLAAHFDDDRLSLAAACPYGADDRGRLARLAALAAHLSVPLVATNDAHYHVPRRRILQDVVTCIRHGCTIEDAGHRLHPNAERHLKPPEEMARLFAGYPAAIARTVEIAERCSGFNLDQLKYQYPHEICPPGRTPLEHLVELTWQGAAGRYPDGVPAKVRGQIEHELKLIDELDYAPYFITVHDLVKVARQRGILCQGRGAAANSAVRYSLGVTSVDPIRINLLFERFVSHARNEPPDIDIDFEHERREEIIQYIYGKYGRDRAALTAEVITYRGRSAVREVGKALGLSLDCVNQLAGARDWWDDQRMQANRLRELGLDPDDATIRRLMETSGDLLGFPRHLSQHVGGFVITERPLCELVPIENAAMEDRTVIEWDKDDIDAMGMLKVDCLGLGMLTCIRKSFEMIEAHHGQSITLATVPAEDPKVYDMLCKADTVGVFQIESRAQMAMLPRLRPRTFYDLVVEVAIVRPGPIQGKMVHPYFRRRSGEEPVPPYPDEKVRRVLERTLGVPIFQEQAMELSMVAAGFTAGEADQLRRTMASWKRKGDQLARFGERLVTGMLERGYERAFAERCYEQLKGFSEYGFPESHSASFALLVYVSSWLKRYHPAAFAASLINSQPMGFYAPAQIVRDAKEHGVTVLPIDVNHSAWDCRLEPIETRRAAESRGGGDEGLALRLGMRLVRGLRKDHADAIAGAVRAHGVFADLHRLRRTAAVPTTALRRLASADAFNSMGLDRQLAVWEIRRLHDEALPLFDEADAVVSTDDPQDVNLPHIALPVRVAQDYGAAGLSLKAHPLSFLRERLAAMRVTPAGDLRDEKAFPSGRRLAVAGLVLCRQRPGTASGIVFITLEDETGVANLIVRPKVYDRYRRAARHSAVLLTHGTIERKHDVVHLMVTRMEDAGPLLQDEMHGLRSRSRDFQ